MDNMSTFLDFLHFYKCIQCIQDGNYFSINHLLLPQPSLSPANYRLFSKLYFFPQHSCFQETIFSLVPFFTFFFFPHFQHPNLRKMWVKLHKTVTPSASLVAQWYGIHLPMQVMQVLSLGREDPMEEETATYFSIFVWRIPWTEEPGRERVGQDLATKQQQKDTKQSHASALTKSKHQVFTYVNQRNRV